MTKTKATLYKAFVTGLLFLLAASSVIGQRRNSYSGDFTIGKYHGTANYTYRVVGIDTILDGPFKMERSNLEALLQKNDSSYSFSGDFKNGKPQGNWVFQFGNFQTDSTAKVSGFQYQINVNGTLKEAKGNFIEGQANGKWLFSQKRIQDSQIQDTLFFSEVTFANGIPQQNFRIGNPKGVLLGRFLRSGLAHDTWAFYTDEAENKENWYFEDGRLKKIEKATDEGGYISINVFENEFPKSEVIALDKGFSTLVSIYERNGRAKTSKASSNINSLLVRNSSYYGEVDDILSELGSPVFLTGFKVKAPHFPLDSLAIKQLDSTVQLVKASSELSKGFLENTRLNLIKRSDEEANRLYHTIAALDTIFLTPLRKLVELRDLGIADNLDTNRLEAYLFPEGRPVPELSITADSDSIYAFVGPNHKSFDFNTAGMAGYLQLSKYVSGSIHQINETLSQKLVDDKQQQEFTLLEEQMIAQVNGLNQFPDSVRQRLQKPIQLALDSIKGKAETLLSQYAEMPTDEAKLNQARMLITCLLNFEKLSQGLVSLPETSAELEKKYTDAVWNPFTATIMDEMVKKRITGAYKNVLLPYILEKTTNDLDCANVEPINTLLTNINERMLELRDEDTSKLERKLRKERNPETVLQMFNLKPL